MGQEGEGFSSACTPDRPLSPGEEVRFALDSPLEGDGFELAV